jgi:DNA modification methylase
MTHAIVAADLLAYLRGNRWLVQNGYLPKVHAILCDPPYGLEFMGKEWDKPKPSGLMATRNKREAKHLNPAFPSQTASPFLAAAVNKYVAGEDFQHWVTEWAELLIDYVHPGGLLMAFGGTRTYHRLAAGLEDAGWEISDVIAWTHGQGFPKSASIGKLLDKEAGAAREVVGVNPHARPSDGIYNAVYSGVKGHDPHITAPATPLAARWEGYGTALKPAFEPCVVARAPRGKRTYAALAREFGTGALAIDAARIGTETRTYNGGGPNHIKLSNHGRGDTGIGMMDGSGKHLVFSATGRWPANFALVCACESDDHAADCPTARLGDDARFFYTAKAAAWEREAGLSARSTHPTHKPIRMAEYLATLLLPPELDEPRRLLVPFAGSGSEMIGALLAGWDDVTGIEREAEYVAIARARVGRWAQFGTYDAARSAYEKERKARPVVIPAPVVVEDKPAQMTLFEQETSA